VQFVDLTSGAPWETLRLTTVGRDSEFFESFLNHARDSAASAQEGCTVIYTSWGTGVYVLPASSEASGQSHCACLHSHLVRCCHSAHAHVVCCFHSAHVPLSCTADWQPFGQPRKKRPLPSVVLDDGVAESIVNDVKTFIGSLQV
jgi:chaperone BCS1